MEGHLQISRLPNIVKGLEDTSDKSEFVRTRELAHVHYLKANSNVRRCQVVDMALDVMKICFLP